MIYDFQIFDMFYFKFFGKSTFYRSDGFLFDFFNYFNGGEVI